MTRTLSKHGNSWALVIPLPILQILGVKDPENAEWEIKTNGESLELTPIKEEKKKAVAR